jgi:hypothetical protein
MDETNLSITTMRHLPYDDLYEFNDSIISRIKIIVSRILRLVLRFNIYEAAFLSFDQSVKRPLSAPETPILKELDSLRKGVFYIIDDFVKKNAQHSVVASMKVASVALSPTLDTYSETPKFDYEGETGAIKNLMQEFDKPENVIHLATLGLTAHVASLKQLNLDFQANYENRLQNRYDFKQDGTTRQRSRILIDETAKFCKAVDGLLLTASDANEIADLKSIVSIINATTEQYTLIVHHRMGILAAKKKHDKEDGKGNGKEDSETQTPDTANPPAPDTPPQNPDTENPPAPDTPPQTPGNITPPTIDPDELNPPAVGER